MIETFIFVTFVVIEMIVLDSRINSDCVVILGEDVLAEGAKRETSNGYIYCAFMGIPYAVPPDGSNRFELPKKIPLWEDRKQFTEDANVCVQMSYETFEAIGSEDCLYLNIYTIISRQTGNTQEENAGNLMPVMFFIHGGSFNIGSSGSDLNKPDLTLEEEIVIVTINYRLGPFGFLSYGNVTRNIGLHDQRMALKWVHENIVNFGGNRARITLAGWSSGGASASYHMYANKSKGLFDKAILMSGNVLNPWAFESDVQTCTYELLKQLNIQNSMFTIEDLKAIDAYDLIPPLFTDELKIDFLGSEQFCFVPTLDDDFLPHPPHINIRQPNPSNVPLLIGMTSLESDWTMSFEFSNFKYPNENRNISGDLNAFMARLFEVDTIEVDRFIRKFQHASDMSFGIYQFLRHYLDATKQENVFVYRFAFDGKSSGLKENSGAIHGDELMYLFKHNFEDVDVYRKIFVNDKIMEQKMVTMWGNFIRFGNPTPNSHDDDDFSIHINWPPFSIDDERLLLNIDYDTTVQRLSDNDGAFKLWDSIYQCMYYFECNELNEYLFNNKTIEF